MEDIAYLFAATCKASGVHAIDDDTGTCMTCGVSFFTLMKKEEPPALEAKKQGVVLPFRPPATPTTDR
jgi:hypothetical protein